MNSNNTILPITAGRDGTGSLTIAGHALRPLAEKYGTPLYLYDAATIRTQVARLHEELERHYPGSFEITYASKAYLSLGYARHLRRLDLGIDVVSLGELAVARQAGFEPGRVHLHGNNKSVEELSNALDWGVQAIVVDSLEELEILEDLARQAGKVARIWLRVSPGVAVDSHSYLQTAHHTSKFGLTTQAGQAADALRRALGSRWLKLTGLHTHLGSQFFEAEPYKHAIASLMQLAEENGFTPEEISPGGGWGVPYLPEQPEGDLTAWISTVTGTLRAECARRNWPITRARPCTRRVTPRCWPNAQMRHPNTR